MTHPVGRKCHRGAIRETGVELTMIMTIVRKMVIAGKVLHEEMKTTTTMIRESEQGPDLKHHHHHRGGVDLTIAAAMRGGGEGGAGDGAGRDPDLDPDLDRGPKIEREERGGEGGLIRGHRGEMTATETMIPTTSETMDITAGERRRRRGLRSGEVLLRPTPPDTIATIARRITTGTTMGMSLSDVKSIE